MDAPSFRKALPVLCTLGVAIVPPLLSRAHPRYAEGPPPGHTGGFGEPTCQACHFERPLNDPAGSLELRGLPRAYAPGVGYTLTVALTKGDMRRAGFQLATRFAEGPAAARQAGTLAVLDYGAQVLTDSTTGVQYAQHTREGSDLRAAGEARWTVRWSAPRAARGPVVFHVAANAANDDLSEFGDAIYTHSVTVRRR